MQRSASSVPVLHPLSSFDPGPVDEKCDSTPPEDECGPLPAAIATTATPHSTPDRPSGRTAIVDHLPGIAIPDSHVNVWMSTGRVQSGLHFDE